LHGAAKHVAREHIGVGAGKFLGMRRIFAQTSPNLPEKHSKENDFKKRLQFMLVPASFLPKFYPNLPKFSLLCLHKVNEIMTSKKFFSGYHFCKIKVHTVILRTFSQILPKFPQILPGF